MRKFYWGIDNGSSGAIAFINTEANHYKLFQTPVRLVQDYTKSKKNINRIDVFNFKKILDSTIDSSDVFFVLERPFINPRFFSATLSAFRCLEATLIILDSYNFPYMFIDSKEWQKVLLPRDIKGKEDLKKASHDIGIRLFPQMEAMINKQKDADALLIAEYARRNNL